MIEWDGVPDVDGRGGMDSLQAPVLAGIRQRGSQMTVLQISAAALLIALAPATMPAASGSADQSLCQTNCAGNRLCEFWQDILCA
jgi:hypothetical protein